MSSPLPNSPTLAAARERVVRLLTDRYADDTLTVEQLEAELDRLHALHDVGALDRMGNELATGSRPALARPTSSPPPPAAWSSPAPPVGGPVGGALGWQRGVLVPARGLDERHLLAVMSSTRRAGPWLVPRTLHVWAVMSEAVVDLRDAVLPSEGCDVEVSAIMANVRVLLPAGVDAEVDVLAFLGSSRDLTHAGPGGGRAPRVRVTGSAVMAEVKVLQGAAADLEALELDD